MQAARTQQQQQAPPPPAASQAGKKPSPLLSMGFAAVGGNEGYVFDLYHLCPLLRLRSNLCFALHGRGNGSDDDEGFAYAKPGFAKVRHRCTEFICANRNSVLLHAYLVLSQRAEQHSDTESDTVSEFSEDSRAYSVPPANSSPLPGKAAPSRASSVVVPPPKIAVAAAPPPPAVSHWLCNQAMHFTYLRAVFQIAEAWLWSLGQQ